MPENSLSNASSFSGSTSQTLELLSAVASAIPDAMFVKDLTGKYLFCNDAGARFLGQPLEKILNHDDVVLLGHDAAQQIQVADQRVMSTGISETEEQIVTAVDVVRVFQFTRTPYRDQQGNLLGVIGHARETTTEYRAEETIRQITTVNSATGQAYFEAMVVQLCQACQVKMAFIGVLGSLHSTEIRTLTVCQDGKLVGNFSYDLTNTPCEKVVRNGFCFYPTGVQQAFPLDLMLVEMGIESYMGIPLFSGAGRPLGLIVLLNDRAFPSPDRSKPILKNIAARSGAELERMQAEQSLKLSEQRFSLFMQHLPGLAWIKGSDGKYVYANDAAVKVFGSPRQQIYGKDDFEIFPYEKAAEFRSADSQALETGQGIQTVETLKHDDGILHYSLVSKFPIPSLDGGGVLVGGIAMDITEQKQSDETIRKLNRFRETVIRTAAEGICVCYPVPEFPIVEFTVWNEQMTKLTGYTIEEINRLGWYQSLYPDLEVRERAQIRMDKMWHGDDLRAEEWEITRKDGERRIVAISTSRLEIDENTPGVVALIQDVTDRKRDEAELRATTDLLHAVTEGTSDAIFVKDLDGRYLLLNGATCRIVGKDASEVLGRDDTAIFDAESAQWLKNRDRELMRSGIVTTQEETVSINGVPRTYLATKGPYRDESGDVIGLIGISTDITERKNSERLLQENEERFRLLMDSIPAYISYVDSNERYCWVNLKYEQWYQRPRQEIIGKTVRELQSEANYQAIKGSLHRVLQGETVHYELTLKSADNQLLTFDNRYVPHFTADGKVAGCYVLVFDVTEERQAQTALRESEKRYRKLFESCADGIFVLDARGQICSANPAGARMHGYTLEELLERNIRDIDSPEDAQLVSERLERLRSGESLSFEVEHFRKDGTKFPVEVVASPFLVDDEFFVLAFDRDISERKAALRSLRLAKFSIDRAVDSVFWINSSGEIFQVNDAACRVLGYTHEELVGKSIADIDPHFPREAWPAHWDELKRKGAFTFESAHRTRNGRLLTVEVTANYLTYDGEEYNCSVTRDITDRKLAENEIRQSLSRLQATLDSTADGILVVDLKGRIVDYNQQFITVWGFPTEMIAESRKSDMIDFFNQHQAIESMLNQLKDPERFVQRVKEMFNATDRPSFDVLEFKSGRVLERFSQPQWIDGRPVGRVLSFRDVTERKHLEEQLRQSQKMEAVGQLAGGIAHDFNNLLTVINGYCDLLLGDNNSHRESWRASVQEIREAGTRAAQLTQQLLAFSRRSRIQPRILNLNDVIAGAAKLLRRLIGEHITLVVQLAPDIDAINADAIQLEQVLMNLVVNSRDAMPEGGLLTINTSIVSREVPGGVNHGQVTINAERGKSIQYVRLQVTDTGAGMVPAVQSRIFEPFFTTKETGKGSGLGLSVVHGIMEQHGGVIEVASQPGTGTTFTLLFPAIDHDPQAQADREPSVSHGSETIFLVEDEPGVRKMARMMLESRGFRVLEASNGPEALKRFREAAEPIDLLLTDVVMPGMSGHELADTLRAENNELRVVYASGYNADAGFLQSPLKPHEAYLQKPFSQQQLVNTIRQHLDKHRG